MTTTILPRAGATASNAEDAAYARVTWRLLPLLFICYVAAYLDRVNVGFAKLQMLNDLHFSEAIYGLGAGIFFLGYFIFEVPSNLALHRYGARKWIARIMVTWGILSSAMLFADGAATFYLLRFLLGVAEAGFFPGIILYLTYWFPARERARMVAFFMTAIAFATVLGNPLSGAIMEYMAVAGGLKGWQWLFLLEGLPSVVLGIVVLFVLTDRPEQARWLTDEEREWLARRLGQEERDIRQQHGADRLRVLVEDKRVWLLICLYFTVAVGANAFGAYLPRLLEISFPSYNFFQIGLIGSLPSLCAVLGMTLWASHSDRTGERVGHVAIAALVAAVGWSLAAMNFSPVLSLVGLCLALMGMMSMLPVFWTLPNTFLTGAAAAGGIALINSFGNIGGILGALILGEFGLWAMAGILFAGVVLTVFVRPKKPMTKPLAEVTHHA